MLKAKVNDVKEFTIETGREIKVDEVLFNGDWVKTGENKYHLIWNDGSYTVELAGKDETGKMLTVYVNGQKYQVAISDRYDALLKQLGLDKLTSGKMNQLKAPMPGLVLKIVVKEGDEVKKGDSLLVLEAMKMENNIKSPGDGVVKKINVEERTAVDKNQVLITFE